MILKCRGQITGQISHDALPNLVKEWMSETKLEEFDMLYVICWGPKTLMTLLKKADMQGYCYVGSGRSPHWPP